MKPREYLILAGLLLAVAGGPALAGPAEAEALYSRYHQAIEAAKLCRDMSFGDSEHGLMSDAINAKIQHSIGAKRLSLVTAAQRDAQDMIDQDGCQGAQVGELLGLFDRDLAPALP